MFLLIIFRIDCTQMKVLIGDKILRKKTLLKALVLQGRIAKDVSEGFRSVFRHAGL